MNRLFELDMTKTMIVEERQGVPSIRPVRRLAHDESAVIAKARRASENGSSCIGAPQDELT